MVVPRKIDMTALDHQVCDEVSKLRKDMNLSASVFARQLGITVRTLGRWEAHHYAPRTCHLVRIKQLRDMQDHLDTRDRDGVPVRFSELPGSSYRVDRRSAKGIRAALAAALLERLGGQATLTKAELDASRGLRPLIKFNPETRVYTARLRRDRRRPFHATLQCPERQ